MFKDILLPTDGSQGVDEAINCAVAIAKKFDGKLHVLYVLEPPRWSDYGSTISLTKVMETVRQAEERIVKETARMIRASSALDVKEAMAQGHPAEEILKYAKENGIDLIVMGTHGRRGLNRVFLGSVAEEVVRSSDVPVMTVRMTA